MQVLRFSQRVRNFSALAPGLGGGGMVGLQEDLPDRRCDDRCWLIANVPEHSS
jgi:hypothetical protein